MLNQLRQYFLRRRDSHDGESTEASHSPASVPPSGASESLPETRPQTQPEPGQNVIPILNAPSAAQARTQRPEAQSAEVHREKPALALVSMGSKADEHGVEAVALEDETAGDERQETRSGFDWMNGKASHRESEAELNDWMDRESAQLFAEEDSEESVQESEERPIFAWPGDHDSQDIETTPSSTAGVDVADTTAGTERQAATEAIGDSIHPDSFNESETSHLDESDSLKESAKESAKKSAAKTQDATAALVSRSTGMEDTLTTPEVDLPPVLARAQRLCAQQQWQEAIALCSQLLKTPEFSLGLSLPGESDPLEQDHYPNSPERSQHRAMAHKLLGTALQATGRSDMALTHYHQALTLRPDFAEVYVNLGNLHARQEHWEEAIYAYQRAIALKPTFAGAYRNLAKVWMQLKKSRLAAECWYQAMVLEPDSATPDQHFSLGQVLAQQGQIRQAIACYRRVVEQDDSHLGAYLHLAAAHAEAEQWSEAIGCFRQALRLKPSLLNELQTLHEGNRGAESRSAIAPALETALSAVAQRPSQEMTWPGFWSREASRYANQNQWKQAIALAHKGLSQMEAEAASLYQLLGQALRATGQIEAAIQYYRKLVAIWPDSADGFANLGSLFAQQKQWQSAITAYQRAIALNPNFAGVYRNLARVWMQVGNGEAAAEAWYRALSLEPSFATAEEHASLGNTLVNQRRLDLAETCYRQALALNNALPQIHHRLGYVLAQQEKYEAAIAHYQQAIRQHPAATESHYQLGQVLARCGQWEEAIASYRQVIELEPQEPRGYLSLRQVLVQQGQWDEAIPCYRMLAKLQPRSWEAQHQLGEVLVRAQQWDSAIPPLQRALQLDPEAVSTHYLLGHALTREGDSAEAVEVLNRAIALKPDAANGYAHLGDALMQLQEWDRAITAYREAIARQPDATSVSQRLALALRRRSEADVAEAAAHLKQAIQERPDDIEAYQRVLAIQPDNLDLQVQLAQLLEKRGQPAEAAEAYAAALRLQPNRADIAHRLGDVLSHLERWEEAIAPYQTAIRFNPDFSWSHHNLGDALLKLKRWEEAVMALTQATRLNPDFHWSHQNLGDALFKLERWDGAIAAYDRAIQLHPDWAWSHYNRGNALAKLERWQEAIAAYREAIRLNPDFHDAHRNLGDLLTRLEQWDSVIHHYQKTVDLAPDSPVSVYKNLGEALLKTADPDGDMDEVTQRAIATPRICIITPVYNGEQFIDDTIYSIVTQAGHFHLRYHVQDGQSTDSTLEKVRAWARRLRSPEFVALCASIEFTYDSCPDQGMYDAINKGVAAIQPEPEDYMTWLNADDRLATGALATVTSIFSTFETVQWLGGRTALMNEQGVTTRVFEPILYSRRALQSGLHDGRSLPFVMQEGTFWRASLWQAAGGLNPTFRLAGDYDLWRRFAAHADYVFVDSVLASHRRHAGQLSSSLERYQEEIDQALSEQEWVTYSSTWEVFNNCSTADLMAQGFASPLLNYDGDRQTWQLATVAPTLSLHPALVVSAADATSEIDVFFGDGFGPAEGPYPTKGLPAGIRWTHERRNQIRLHAPQSGHYNLTLTCQTFSNLRVQLLLEGQPIFSSQLPVTCHSRNCKVVASALLMAGENPVELVLEGDADAGLPRLLVLACEVVMTQPALQQGQTGVNAGWPYEPEDDWAPPMLRDRPRPATLPDGSPWPRISIITPSYNQGEFIEETILSVIHQGYPNLEYIIIDGNSTDETMAVINRYREHISFVLSEPDQGQSDALNKGFRHTTGEILGWLNSDDRLAPGALYAAALAFYTSGADLVAGFCQVLTDGLIVNQHLPSCPSGELALADILDLETCWLAGKFFYQPEVLFTHDLWKRAGGCVNESLYYSMDYELWARFAAEGARIQVIGHAIAQYRMHPAQKTSTVDQYRPELMATRDALRQQLSQGLNPQLSQPLSWAIAPSASSHPQRQRLRIVVFNDIGFYGGAGIAHQRIATTLALAGHEVIPVAGRAWWHETPQLCAPDLVEHVVNSLQPDLVVVGNLHNLDGGLEILERLSDRLPTIFVMHDQWLLTGRCAYTGRCDRYLSECDHRCPTATEYPQLSPDAVADAFHQKRSLIQRHIQSSLQPGVKSNLLIVGDSDWMTRWARAAFCQSLPPAQRRVAERQFQTLHYGLDLSTFRPMDKAECRRLLDLPQDAFILLTGCQSVDDVRKGVAYLFKALELAHLDNGLLLSFGHGTAHHPRIPIRSIGYVNDPAILALYYGAADLFVGPSLEEAFGQTFIEAAACGTPAVGFAVGGVPEAIGDRLSGRLVYDTTPEALAEVLQELHGDRQQLDQLSATAPLYVANRFSWGASYHELMQALAQVGWLDRLNLQPNSTFAPEVPVLPQPIYLYPNPGHGAGGSNRDIFSGELQGRVLSGFGELELLQAQGQSTPQPVRWAFWHKSRFALASNQPQIVQMRLRCRNFVEGQHVELWQGDTHRLFSTPITQLDESQTLTATVHLQKGANPFNLFTSKCLTATDQRSLGLLIEDITVTNAALQQRTLQFPVDGTDTAPSNRTEFRMVMEDSLRGRGWFPAETYGDQPVRWMKKRGLVFIPPLTTHLPLRLSIQGVMAVDDRVLKHLIVRWNGHRLVGQLTHASADSWQYDTQLHPSQLDLSGEGLLTLEASGVKPLSPQDDRQASLLVKAIAIQPLA